MEKDMTSGSPLKLIFWFSIPVLLGNIFQQFYNMADAIIVGRLLGEDALAADFAAAEFFRAENGLFQLWLLGQHGAAEPPAK